MLSLPSSVEPILMSFSVAFTEPTAARMVVLMVGTILARGRRTVTAALRVMGASAPGHFSDYHRVFSRAHRPRPKSRLSVWPSRSPAAHKKQSVFPRQSVKSQKRNAPIVFT